jgi:hypothetical protein
MAGWWVKGDPVRAAAILPGLLQIHLAHLMSVVWLVTLRHPSPLWRKVPRLAGGGSAGRGDQGEPVAVGVLEQ